MFCKNWSLALLALKDPHSGAAAEVICRVRRTVNCLHPRTGKTGPIVTRTASYHGLQNICSHDHSLRQSWAPCACLVLRTLETPTQGSSLCASPTGAVQLWERKLVLLTRSVAFCLLPCTRENHFWEPDPRAGLRGGHWRSVSYRFICKHEKTSSGVNKNTESRGAIFPNQKQ